MAEGESAFDVGELTAEQVEKLHRNADTDTRRESIHHTLGPSPTQAAPGSHRHDGSDSALLLEGVTISGSISSPPSILPSIIAALVKLGALDQSTP